MDPLAQETGAVSNSDTGTCRGEDKDESSHGEEVDADGEADEAPGLFHEPWYVPWGFNVETL